jgi:hypothetical protein
MYMSARIRQHIFSLEEGVLFTSRDLLRYGTRCTVDQTLFRLLKRGVIVRIARGVFMRETDTGWRPGAQEVATVKARAFGKQIYLERQTGGAHDGSSNGLFSDRTFRCSGRSSSFVYGEQRIYLRAALPGESRRSPPASKSGRKPPASFKPDYLACLAWIGRLPYVLEDIDACYGREPSVCGNTMRTIELSSCWLT